MALRLHRYVGAAWASLRAHRHTSIALTSSATSSFVWPCDRGLRALSTRLRRPQPLPTSPANPSPAEPDEPPVLVLPPHYTLGRNDIHCFLGLNGSGKSRLLHEIQQAAASAATDAATGRRLHMATLSFDAHRAFVSQHGERVVADVLGGIGSPDARDLIVRLGLYPVWDSHVRHLSTGEMRKVLLAVALLQVPRATVLILDQPFDGLDKAARRQLEWMLGQLTRGFTRLLVETGARNEAFAYKTQVLLVANRLEHVFPGILSHVVLTRKNKSKLAVESLDVEIRPLANPELPEEMLEELQQFVYDEAHRASDHTAPSIADDTIQTLVKRLYAGRALPDGEQLALELRQLSVAYGSRLLLDELSFKRERHAHWVLLGPNGSGKSSLMRVLIQSQGHGQVSGDVVVHGDKIAVVSTDLHLEMLENGAYTERTTLEWLQQSSLQDQNAVETVVELLGISHDLLPRKFHELSQGEQKLVQIANAVVQRPDVLILDEITHGLDMFNRQRVLRVINALGRYSSAHTHLILITHHEDEIVDCFRDVFEIHDQKLRPVERL